MALLAEAVGFDSVTLGDHLLLHFPPNEDEGVWDGWSLVAALAEATTRVELTLLVACTGFRNPALLAKMADTVDEISDGRLVLGLGAGWHEPEFRMFGLPFDHRASRFEEALTIITTLLREGYVDFKGRFHEAHDAVLRPRGPRISGPPILIGAAGERMLQLTARFADIWNRDFAPFNSMAELGTWRTKLDAACLEIGRDPATLDRTAAVVVDLPSAGVTWRQDWGPLTGSSEMLAESLRSYALEGITHVQVWLEPATPAGIEEFAPVLEMLDRGE
jgi:alkanesulfonate monooxygenase SsuD/methylene tetrahydromethanopterin reductase-like flavin-dependent oxidoreductase (luciferase family)